MDIAYLVKKNYKYIILIFIIIIILIIFIKKNNPKAINNMELEQVIIEDNNKLINNKIDIKGAINNPGVYEYIEGNRVDDAIKLAGGLTIDADTSTINLSKNLNNEMVIIIYTKEEIKQLTKGDTIIKVIDKECICPQIENSACIDKNDLIDNQPNNENNEKTNGKININTASVKELADLPGIGESKAEEIINYREINNGFKSIDELQKVSGIGSKTFEKIKDLITI